MTAPARFWATVEPAWQECFRLAWESFRARSIPVGAVLVDPAGSIVSRGRNRMADTTAPHGQLSGSFLAHAEVNALATLAPGHYPEHVLYSTLEPCFLCTAALRHSHVGTVRYAAADSHWAGVERLPEISPAMARHWTRREGPAGGPLERFATVLHLVSAVERGVRSVLEQHERVVPELVAAARGVAPDELRKASLSEAFATLWPPR